MASDIMQQVQEDSLKKKQQGVLSRLSSTAPRSAGVGGYGTPEPTVVEKAKEVQKEEVVAEPKIEDPRSMSDRDRRMAQVAAAAEGARYRAALQSPDAGKRDIDASRMAEFGDVGDVIGAKDSGFEEQYDADVKFQEEEYGGGSIERDRMLAEIMGQEYQTDPDPGEDTELYEKYYAEAKEKNTEASEKEIQDMAIKKWVANRSRKAELAAKKFPKPLASEATETVAAGLRSEQTLEEMEAEEAERLKKEKAGVVTRAVENAKESGPGGADTRRQPTAAELAARKAAEEERRRAEEERQQNAELAETTTDEVIEDTVDETTTEKSIEEDEEEAEKITELAVRNAAAKEAFDAGFANVLMPGLRKQSSELYNSFDKVYRSMYPSQEEMSKYPGARRRLVKRRNALDTIKNKLFRSSPDQWGNRPYGTGMNLDDAIKELEDELPTATKQIKQMVRRMRGFHTLMNRYGEDAQLKGAFDLENLLRNTRLRGEKSLEESGEVLRPIRTEGSLDDSPVEEIIASAAAGE